MANKKTNNLEFKSHYVSSTKTYKLSKGSALKFNKGFGISKEKIPRLSKRKSVLKTSKDKKKVQRRIQRRYASKNNSNVFKSSFDTFDNYRSKNNVNTFEAEQKPFSDKNHNLKLKSHKKKKLKHNKNEKLKGKHITPTFRSENKINTNIDSKETSKLNNSKGNILLEKPKKIKIVRNLKTHNQKLKFNNNIKSIDNSKKVSPSPSSSSNRRFKTKNICYIHNSKYRKKALRIEKKYNKNIKKIEKTDKKIQKILYKNQKKIVPKDESKLIQSPRYYRKNFLVPIIKKSGITVYKEGRRFVRKKLKEVEDDVIAIKPILKAEQKLNSLLVFLYYRKKGKLKRLNKTSGRLKYREHKLKSKSSKLNNKFEDVRSKEIDKIAKLNQKRLYKKKYAVAKTTAQSIENTIKTKNIFTVIAAAIKKAVFVKKAILGICIFLVTLILLLFGSFIFLFLNGSAVTQALVSTCYLADDEDINQADLYYSEKEADLEIEINELRDNVEDIYPGYDRYRFNIGEIDHNEYELMGYLTARFDDFKFEEIKSELDKIFKRQYVLKIYVTTEETTGSDGKTHTITILNIDLIVTSITAMAKSDFTGEKAERYNLYMQTYGNRQTFSNPFEGSTYEKWLSYLSSGYGYRVNTIIEVDDEGNETKKYEKELHRGIDIAVPVGTEIKSIQNGVVKIATYSESFGYYVVIEEEKRGYITKYAHCDELLVSVGDEVKKGDLIALSGDTGKSTGAHLHLETMHYDEYLNPLYFIDNGMYGELSNDIEYPDNPGNAMGLSDYEKLIQEAEKYLGYPYVWGGSRPETSFDCSGYVCWVYTNSGVYDLPRTTAQGIYNQCTPVSKENAQPGDLIFFTGTYSTSNPVTHIGIYVGNGKMLHCGDPIGYANINTSYWQSHFYSFGRLRNFD